MHSPFTHSAPSYVALLDSYLDQYEEDGGEAYDTPAPLQYGHIVARAVHSPDHGQPVASLPPSLPLSAHHGVDVDSFLQQKMVELNCRRRRNQQLNTLLDLELDAEESVLDTTARAPAGAAVRPGSAGLSLDELLFDGAMEASISAADEGVGASFQTTTLNRSAQAHQRYHRVRAAAQDLEAESTRALETLHSRRRQQQALADRMERSILRNASILFDHSDERDSSIHRQDNTQWTSPAFRAGEDDSEGFDAWLRSFKAARPSAATLGGAPEPDGRMDVPKTPPAPPRFEDSPVRAPRAAAVASISGDPPRTPEHPSTALCESPSRSAPPVRHSPPPPPPAPRDSGGEQQWASEGSFSALDGQCGDASLEARPPPHPLSRLGPMAVPHLAQRRGGGAALSRNRFINM